MEDTLLIQDGVLRIRQFTSNNQRVIYKNIELSKNGTLSRDTVGPCMVKRDGKGNADNITFVPDTVHNRAVFLQNDSVEVSIYDSGKQEWHLLPKGWLKVAFASTVGGTISQIAKVKPAVPPEKKQPKTIITNFEDFENLPKGLQGKSFQQLMNEGPKEVFNFIVRGIRANKANPKIAKTVMALSDQC